MNKKYLLILVSYLAISCSSSSALLKKRMDEISATFKNGDVIVAYGLLKNGVDKEQLTSAPEALKVRYEKLNTDLTRGIEYLIERWLSRADELFSKGDISGAMQYYNDLLRNLPPGDQVRSLIEKESEPVRKKRSSVLSEYNDLLNQAKQELSSGNILKAREKLILAQQEATKWNLKISLQADRLLEECKRRMPGAEVGEQEDEDQLPGKTALVKKVLKKGGQGSAKSSLKERIYNRRRLKKKKALVSPKSAPGVKDRVEETYRLGLKMEKEGKDLKALLYFLRVLKLRPSHAGAKAGLKRLEPARRRLIEKWLKTASEYFAKEDLESAAPYYRKVIQIDPGNLRAKEGLQMYLRLRQLKKRQ